MRLGCPVIPANGGDSDSQANTSTTNNTTNTALNTDRRAVASEEAISVTGDGNAVSRNTSNTTTFTDNSDRSSKTSFTDTSNRSTTTISYQTDFGSVQAALGGMERVAGRAVDTSQISINGAIDSLNKTGANSVALAMRAFDMAKEQSANAITNTNAALGFAESAIGQTRAAFAEAKDGGTNKTMLLVALAVVGAVGVATAMK